MRRGDTYRSQAIRHAIRDLQSEPWLEPYRSSWPAHLYRFENIDSAARILASGQVLSRQQAIQSGVIATDIASQEVLGNTDAYWKSFVRLYFRPRTPMQFEVEGVRVQTDLKYDVQCPCPIVFVFDAANILVRRGVRFSDRNLAASGYQIGSSPEFFAALPFSKIYHVGPVNDDDKSDIIAHRQAEVLVPNRLDLSALRYVVCRSTAERETLLYLLGDEVRARFEEKIRVGPARSHFRHRTFIDRVCINDGILVARFKTDSSRHDMFNICVSIMVDYIMNVWEVTYVYSPAKPLRIDLRGPRRGSICSVKIQLDDMMVYRNNIRVP